VLPVIGNAADDAEYCEPTPAPEVQNTTAGTPSITAANGALLPATGAKLPVAYDGVLAVAARLRHTPPLTKSSARRSTSKRLDANCVEGEGVADDVNDDVDDVVGDAVVDALAVTVGVCVIEALPDGVFDGVPMSDDVGEYEGEGVTDGVVEPDGVLDGVSDADGVTDGEGGFDGV